MLVEVLHLLKLIIGLFLMVTIVVVLILQTFKTLYDMGYLGNRSYPNLCAIHSEAIKMLYEGVPHGEVLKKLRKMRFDFKMPAPTNEKLQKSLEFTNRVLQNDRLMHEYILVPCFDRKQYNALLKEDLAEGTTCIDTPPRPGLLFNDDSDENISRMENLLAEWLTKPFLMKGAHKGRHQSAIFSCLQNKGIIKRTISYNRYIESMVELKKKYPKMSVTTSKGTISYNINRVKTTNLDYMELDKKITEILQREHD